MSNTGVSLLSATAAWWSPYLAKRAMYLVEVDEIPEEGGADLIPQVLVTGGLDDRVQVLLLLLLRLAQLLRLLSLHPRAPLTQFFNPGRVWNAVRAWTATMGWPGVWGLSSSAQLEGGGAP